MRAPALARCGGPHLLHRLGVPYERVFTFATLQYFSFDRARSPEIEYAFSRSIREATKPKHPLHRNIVDVALVRRWDVSYGNVSTARAQSPSMCLMEPDPAQRKFS